LRPSRIGKATTIPVLVVTGLFGWFGDRRTEVDYSKLGSRERVLELHQLVEQSLVARTTTLKLVKDLAKRPKAPLTGNDLKILKGGTRYYLDLRNRLYELAEAGEPLLELSGRKLARLGLTPDERLNGIMLSLAAALTLYDNYVLAAIVFEQDARLRNLLNDPDQGFGVDANQLAKVTLSANSLRKRHRLRKAIRYYEHEMQHRRSIPSSLACLHRDQTFRYLHGLIEGSPSYSFVRKIRLGEMALANFGFFSHVGTDMLKEAEERFNYK